MPRVIGIEWDDAELRAIVATAQGDSAQIEQIISTPLPASLTPAERTQALSLVTEQFLKDAGKGKVLVALGRGNGELRKLTLPPAPAAEVPDLVRFQAMRDFNEIADEATIDYLPLFSSETEPQQVLAATITPQTLQHVQKLAAEATNELEHVTVRAAGIAALLRDEAPTSEGELLLSISAGKQDLDLVCLHGSKIVFLRSARLVHEEGVTTLDAILWELRRTLLAVQSQLAPQKVGQIVILGKTDALVGLEAAIREQATVPCRTIDPLARLSRGAGVTLPDQTSSFAPLVGLVQDATKGVAPLLDFLHPRRKPEPVSALRKYGVWAAIAAGILLVISAPAVYGKYRDEAQLSDLIQRIEQTRVKEGEAKDTIKKLEDVVRWSEVDISWLDEMAELSDELPKSDQLMLTHLSGNLHDTNGTMDMDGLVADADVFFDMLANVNDDRHFMDSPDYSPSSKQKDYLVSFNKGQLLIKPRVPKPATPVGKEVNRAAQ
jgi:Tfp pilus assembly PilM family ATPase